MCKCRLKVTAPFYAEFKADSPATVLNIPSAAVSVTASAKAIMTLEAIASRVMGAVVAVMGSAVQAEQPLVEAGLDSLGEGSGRSQLCGPLVPHVP